MKNKDMSSDFMDDFFSFEERDYDFPFYNGKPELKKTDWMILLGALIVKIAFIFGLWGLVPGIKHMHPIVPTIIELLALIVPIAYCCRGKLGLVIRKPQLKDFKIIILCVIAYYAFAIAMGLILRAFGVTGTANPITNTKIPILPLSVIIIISLFDEELFKFMTLTLGMAAAYRFTDDRKTSMIIAIIITCILFGLIHLETYQYNVLQCLLVIGLGCVIHFYPYLKTKNLTNSYITHIIIDMIVILPVVLLGIA